MKPIKFKECNAVYAKDQPEYLPLPVYKSRGGRVLSCWKMNIVERIRVLFTGRVYLDLLTFNKPLQPQLLSTKKFMVIEGITDKGYGNESAHKI